MKRLTLYLLASLLLIARLTAGAADSAWIETPMTLHTASGAIEGTLMLPLHAKKELPVVLLIAGSGPTDRNGNTPLIRGANNSLLYLAQGLAAQGIASLRYDKRGIGKSTMAMKKESDLRIDDYIADARGWLDLLRADGRFKKIAVIGHSEGALIGLAVAPDADRYVSLAGTGFPAAEVLKKQLAAGLPDSLKKAALVTLDSLVAGHLVKHPPAALYALFRPSVQPYLISWLRLDPRRMLQELKRPALIVQGDNDVQISVGDARSLKGAAPKATLLIIPGMNHVLKIVASRDRAENTATYGDPSLPLAPALLKAVTKFIKS
jgi:uncharacterized protein